MSRRGRAVLQRARRLVEAGGTSRAATAKSLGVSPSTLRRWIAKHGWAGAAPKPGRTVRPDCSARWAAARRLFERAGDADVVPDLAILLDLPVVEAAATFAARGFARPSDGVALDGAALRRRLRRHVARQIAALDAELTERPRGPDSSRVLRDVAGLKRVLDALPEEGEGADAGAASDLDALREAIARRYEAFDGGGDPAGLPRDPAGAAPAGTPP